MEEHIFSWENWDLWETGHMVFYDCTVIDDFGPLKKGEQYDSIDIDYREGVLTCSNDDGDVDSVEVHRFELKLVPVED